MGPRARLNRYDEMVHQRGRVGSHELHVCDAVGQVGAILSTAVSLEKRHMASHCRRGSSKHGMQKDPSDIPQFGWLRLGFPRALAFFRDCASGLRY